MTQTATHARPHWAVAERLNLAGWRPHGATCHETRMVMTYRDTKYRVSIGPRVTCFYAVIDKKPSRGKRLIDTNDLDAVLAFAKLLTTPRDPR